MVVFRLWALIDKKIKQNIQIALLFTFILSCGEKDKEPVVLVDNVSEYVQKGLCSDHTRLI